MAVDLPSSPFDAPTDRGWRPSRTATGELPLVRMPHVTRETLRAFLDDVDDCRTDT